MNGEVEEPRYPEDMSEDEAAEEDAFRKRALLRSHRDIRSEYQKYPQPPGPVYSDGLNLHEYPSIAPLSNEHKDTSGLVVLQLDPFTPGVPRYYAYTSDDILRRNPELQNKLARKYKVKYHEPKYYEDFR